LKTLAASRCVGNNRTTLQIRPSTKNETVILGLSTPRASALKRDGEHRFIH
jgi:hypothetical protein